MTKRAVLLAMRGQAEEDFLRGAGTSAHFQVARRCVDTAEVLAAAIAGVGEVALVDYLLGVERTFVHRLRQAGVIAVVVAPSGVRAVVEELGAIHLDADAPDLLGAFAEVLKGQEPVERPPAVETVDATGAREIIAMTSAWGSPGRTTLAVNVAAELAARGNNPLLVDADLWGGSVKQYLGLDPDGAGLAAAVRAVERGTLDLAGLTRLTEPAYGIHVLGGLNRSDRWREVSGAGLSSLWEVVRGWPGHVVIDAPVRLAAGEDGVGHFGPDANSMWETISEAATSVCMVASADTIGIHRFVNFHLDGMIDVHHTIVNRLRASAGGPQARESVLELLARFVGISDPVLVPDDPTVDRAVLEGAPLRVLNGKSPARIAIERFSEQFSPRRRRSAQTPRFGFRPRSRAH